MKKAKLVTGMDVAKVLGVEEEYKDALLEQELNEGMEKFMKSDFKETNHSINPENKNEE